VTIKCLHGRALTHMVVLITKLCCYSVVLFPDCCRVTQTPGKGPIGIRCRHYKTCSLDQSPKCPTLKRTREVMIRLQDWYALTKEAKQLNWPKSVYSRKFVPVNVSSATGIVAGFLPSTSPTDAQNINTGSCYGILFIGIPRALLAALWLLASTTTITLVFLWGKARELSPLPFLKLPSTERTGLQHQQATRIMLAPALQPTLSSAITLLASSCSDMLRSRMAGNLHFTFSTARRTKFGRTLEH